MTDDIHDTQSLRRPIVELGGIALLLTVWMAALYFFTGLPDLARLPAWPGWSAFVVIATSRTAPLSGVLQVTVIAQWSIAIGLAAWFGLSVVLELILVAAEHGPARSSALLGSLRAVLRHASFPLVHQVVATLFALQLIVRLPSAAFAQGTGTTTEQTVSPPRAQPGNTDQESGSSGEIWHTVQAGETLWGISERYYGDGAEFERVVEDNVGRPMSSGRDFTRAGVIRPGDLLKVPLPSTAVEERDGQRFYIVEPGDTLSGIAARLLGDRARYPEIFELNAGTAQLGDRGPVFSDPDLIWPGLRLLLPAAEANSANPVPDQPEEEVTTVAQQVVSPVVADERDRGDHASPQVAPVETVQPSLALTAVPTPATDTSASPTPEPAIQPIEQSGTEQSRPVSPELAALLAAGLAGAGIAARQLVVYKRRAAPLPTGHETDVVIQDGFAESDPVEHLARRLARSSDPEAAISSLLSQAYAAVFAEQLGDEDRRIATDGLSVAATRHGGTSTTLVVAAPLGARPHLVRCMRSAAERAFGEQVDVDGLVGRDGDVLVRVTWDQRRPIGGHLLELVNATTVDSAWQTPWLVPVLVLHDRQHLAVNWHAIRNILISAPAGEGADVPLIALVAALASGRGPEDLGLVVVARPHTLPDEIGIFPHALLDVVDPGDRSAVRAALEEVKAEVDRRRVDGAADAADMVVVVRELADLEPEALDVLAAVAAGGPEYGVQLVVASERPAAELFSRCSFMDKFGTRLVLQAANEEDSVALLGVPGAERLEAGGHAMLRLEGRLPVQGWARHVSPDRLARLLHMMGTRAQRSTVSKAYDDPLITAEARNLVAVEESPPDVQVAGPVPNSVPTPDSSTPRQDVWPASSLLQKLRSAPIRVRCFGAGDAWYGDRLLEIADPQLLLLLAVHPVTGIQTESLVDMLWENPPADVARALRKERFNLRTELRKLVPEVTAEPLPATQVHGEKVVSLDTSVVSSDVHEFTELLRSADKLGSAAAIEAYEAALGLYRGDLLDGPDVPSYRWMYDEDPQVALTLRSDFRRRQKEVRLRLAELLANGPEQGLTRAEELYSGLCAEDPENERLWTALFGVHERTGNAHGLESAVRRYRDAAVELGITDVTDIDSVPLPPNLDRAVQRIRARLDSSVVQAVAGKQ